MKTPISVIIITKDPKTMQEIHNRYDGETGFPRLRLLAVLFRAFFTARF